MSEAVGQRDGRGDHAGLPEADAVTTWHIVTGEYPPTSGGVADYTALVAGGLAAAGDSVHVWCPFSSEAPSRRAGVDAHPILGVRPSDLRRAGSALDRFAPPRRILVQWVPHAYGRRSMNLPFCLWLLSRAHRGDRVELMVHEAFLAFGEGSRKQDLAAAVHRLMVVVLLRAASHVWVAIPAWERAMRPYALGRRLSFECLPVPANIPVAADPDRARASAIRSRFVDRHGALVGHLSTYPRVILQTLARAVPGLLDAGLDVMLLGRGSGDARRQLLATCPPNRAGHLHASGELSADALSRHLQACDLLMQPYPDGVSGRRSTMMAVLAHGRPAVTTVGRLSEAFWAATPGVHVVQAGDDAALEAAVRDLAAQPERRAILGRQARELYEERFDVAHTIAALRRDAMAAAG